LISLLFLLGLSYFQGWTSLYVLPNADIPFPLIKKMPSEFWTIIHPNVKFHIVRPWEWILLTLGMWGAYRHLGKINLNV